LIELLLDLDKSKETIAVCLTRKHYTFWIWEALYFTKCNTDWEYYSYEP